jgi:PII-like signaling protein
LAQWTHKQYETLERAIASGKRISAYRRGTEFVVVPIRLRIIQSREAIEATHPTTGEMITLYLDEMESVEVVR